MGGTQSTEENDKKKRFSFKLTSKKKENISKLKRIVTEILTTERTYVTKLLFLDDVVQKELLQIAPESRVGVDKIQEIFSNLSQIRQFHETILLPDLEERIAGWDKNPRIGDLFKTNGHCLKMYTEYAKNYDNANNRIEKNKKKCKRFSSRVEEIQKRDDCDFSLENQLIYPIQRIPRYKLLLEEYLKKLPEKSPDRQDTEASLLIISQAADHVNNSMKDADKFRKILEIEGRIGEGMKHETLVKPSRVFIKEGELQIMAYSCGEVRKEAATKDNAAPRVMILFNDLLLCASKTAFGKLKVHQVVNLVSITIETDDLSLPESGFRIRTDQVVLDSIAKDDAERNEWVECISKTLNELSTLMKKRQDILEENSKLEKVTRNDEIVDGEDDAYVDIKDDKSIDLSDS